MDCRHDAPVDKGDGDGYDGEDGEGEGADAEHESPRPKVDAATARTAPRLGPLAYSF